ncbi:MAG: SPOR domain-containing protein [Pseudomonadota bacterium]
MILRYLLAAGLVLGGAIPASAQSVNAGIEAWQRGNYAGAVSIWRPLAQAGDADAQFNLGQAYRLGRGVPTNLALAKDWLERAASRNHVDAETTLGLLLFQNGDQAAGLKWLKLAAEAGEPRAMLVYGTALFNGDSVTQDPIMGYAYVYRANASGLAAAKDIMAQIDQLMNGADKKKALAMVQAQEKAAAKALFSPSNPVETATPKPKKTPPAKPAAKPKPKPEPVQTAAAEPAKSVVKPAPAKPTPKPAVSSGPVSGEWRIQLGAFNGRSAAETAYRKLAGNSALAGRSPQYIPFQQFIRLRVGPFASRAAAASACSAVHVPCFPVAPGK